MNEIYLISFCIPTFNRCKALRQTIESIICQEGFDSSIELVISDNASTDETNEMILPFLSHGNIHYFRNEKNTYAGNVMQVLKRGCGKYLKLLSDNKELLPGYIITLKEEIAFEMPIIITLNKKSDTKLAEETNSMDAFLRKVSFGSTWLPAIMIRRSAILESDFREIDSSRLIPQTELVYKILERDPRCRIVEGEYWNEISSNSGGAYNYIDVFINNYLGLIRNYRTAGLISNKSYNYEKKSILLQHIFPYLGRISVCNKNTIIYDNTNIFGNLLRTYRYNYYLYIFPFYLAYKFAKVAFHYFQMMLVKFLWKIPRRRRE